MLIIMDTWKSGKDGVPFHAESGNMFPPIPKGVEKDESKHWVLLGSSNSSSGILSFSFSSKSLWLSFKIHPQYSRSSQSQRKEEPVGMQWEGEIIIVTIYIFIPEIWWYEIYGNCGGIY